MGAIIQIQLRRDTAANWTTSNPLLLEGEPALETDTGKLKFGDGSTTYNSLPYFLADKNLIFTQAVTNTTWVIAHNLNKRPAVQIFDTAGTPLRGQITHIDDNNINIFFNKAVSGKAYLN